MCRICLCAVYRCGARSVPSPKNNELIRRCCEIESEPRARQSQTHRLLEQAHKLNRIHCHCDSKACRYRNTCKWLRVRVRETEIKRVRWQRAEREIRNELFLMWSQHKQCAIAFSTPKQIHDIFIRPLQQNQFYFCQINAIPKIDSIVRKSLAISHSFSATAVRSSSGHRHPLPWYLLWCQHSCRYSCCGMSALANRHSLYWHEAQWFFVHSILLSHLFSFIPFFVLFSFHFVRLFISVRCVISSIFGKRQNSKWQMAITTATTTTTTKTTISLVYILFKCIRIVYATKISIDGRLNAFVMDYQNICRSLSIIAMCCFENEHKNWKIDDELISFCFLFLMSDHCCILHLPFRPSQAQSQFPIALLAHLPFVAFNSKFY